MARRLRRTKEDCYIILMTLTDRKGELPCLKNRSGQMELLREMIQYSIDPSLQPFYICHVFLHRILTTRHAIIPSVQEEEATLWKWDLC